MKKTGLEVIALGTGTCSSVHRGARRRRPPAFLVIVDGVHVLLDCGEGTRMALEDEAVDFRLVTHVAITHGHPDHAALPQFIQAKYCSDIFTRDEIQPPETQELTVYMPDALLSGAGTPPFSEVWRWHCPESPEYWDDFKPKFVGLREGIAHTITNEVSLYPFKVYHGFGKHPSMGFRLTTPYGTIGYTGDCGYTEFLDKRFQGSVDLLIADCSTPIGQGYVGGYGHMDPAQCGRLAKDLHARTLWMTHYIGNNRPFRMIEATQAAGFVGEAIVAEDGMRWSPP